MKVLIIEDEKVAADKLQSMLLEIKPEAEVLAQLQSVDESVLWLQNHSHPDLIFLDIQLSDSLSFDIFEKTDVNVPVIFTTAYDDYILKSFELNAIDYLLKPIKKERLQKALEKIKVFEWHFLQNKLSALLENQDTKTFKNRFVVKKGTEFVAVETSNIAYFYSEHKISFLVDNTGTKYIVDKPLSVLEKEVDTSQFFRINRKYLMNISNIAKFKSDNGKIQIFSNQAISEEVFVSKENAKNFRQWIGS